MDHGRVRGVTDARAAPPSAVAAAPGPAPVARSWDKAALREHITFWSGRDFCDGWFYRPTVAATPLPTIIMAHGFSAVKEQGLEGIAERFCAAGFAVLAFDFRHFGLSSGLPRGQLFPLAMVEDYRCAITWASRQPHVDAQRVGLWGASFSGGVATFAASVDRRVKAVVALAPPLISPAERHALDPARWEIADAFLTADRIARHATGVVKTMPVVARGGRPCALPGQECFDFFAATSADAPTWRNEITLASLEKVREFDPVSLIAMLAPAALMVIAAERDRLTPIDLLEKAVDRASGPKRMLTLPIGHFDVYREPWSSQTTQAALGWFGAHL